MVANRLLAPFSVLVRHRYLAWEMTKREILGRYRGASFGLLWSIFSPFLMLMIYTLAFGYILKSRWPGSNGTTADFALILFAGLVLHGFFSECFTRSVQLIVGNANYVKKVVFPLELLVWSMTFSALFHLLVNLAVLLLLKLLWHGGLPWTALLLPLVLLPFLVLTVGISMACAALGVYLRDLGQVAGVIATAMLFISSAIVPISSVPAAYRWVFMLNPLTFMIDQCRDLVIWGRLPDWKGLGLYLIVALLVLLLGAFVFRKMRGGFADVL
jgi:lipopolysaccharide transport system permease protein